MASRLGTGGARFPGSLDVDELLAARRPGLRARIRFADRMRGLAGAGLSAPPTATR